MDSDGSSMLFGVILFLTVAFIRCCFTVCETALTEISDAKVKSYKNSGDKKERVVYRLLNKPLRMMTAFSAIRILTAALSAFTAVLYFYPPLRDLLIRQTGAQSFWAVLGLKALAVVIVSVLLVLFLTAFTDGIPRRITALGKNKGSEKTAKNCSAFIHGAVIALAPVTLLSEKIIIGVSSLFGIDPAAEKELVTEEDILMMVDAGNENGVIEESQKEMINNVFEFGDLPVSDIMTHRTEISAISVDSGVSELVYLAMNTGFSRIPVYKDSIDHIVGIICVKDLLCLVCGDSADSMLIKDFVRDAIFFPESGMCGTLFKRMTAEKNQLAVIVDEYGGTAGIVSLEDIVESVMGNIQDEYDNETEDIIKISENEYTVSGTANPEEILGELGVSVPEDSDYDTMSGMFIDLLGYIPEDGEMPSVMYKNIRLTALVTEDMRIERLKAEVVSST
ncbi:MAG: hemolysin family protein [Oscillospiraceae bacterium]|nr:hemolysin family protein [Oscillospiraceae bacterium]MDY2847911.1 hemolysin family protein [Oscillospiraceae bacterium]